MSGTDHQHAAADSPTAAAQPGSGPAGDISEVARVTLDSAEVANRAAKAAAQTANRAAEAANRFDGALAAHRKQMLIITGVTAGLAVLSLILFLAAAIQLRGRVAQVNSVVTVMAKRTSELKAGLDNLAAISERLDAFSTQIDNVVQSQTRLRTSMQAAVQGLEQNQARQPAQVAAPAAAASAGPRPPPEPVETAQQRAARDLMLKQTAEAAQAVGAQARSLDGTLKAQAKSLATISERVAAMEQTLASLPEVRRDVRNILDLEKQRAGAVAQAMNDRKREESLRQERERFVQFPVRSGAPGAGSSSEPTGR
jgi:septal ring factor EnvC (AmiA/AmiB activator)